MKCPNCGCNMDNKSFNYYAPIADWDMDYPPRLHEEYFCKVCGMKYLNGEWKIPQEFEPTDKQVNTVMFIERATKFEAPYPLTRGVAREFISRYFKKGSALCITGSIQTRSWTDEGGQKRYATEVVVDEAMFVDSMNNNKSEDSTYVPEAYAAPQFSGDATPNFEEVKTDDDLPF